MTTKTSLILAMDIGGTKIAMGLVDKTAKVHHRMETLTLAHEGRDAILKRVEELGHACDEQHSARFDPRGRSG